MINAQNRIVWQLYTDSLLCFYLKEVSYWCPKELVITNDGWLVLYDYQSKPLWTSTKTSITNGMTLQKGYALQSPDRRYQARFQQDSNFVVYDTVTNNPIWALPSRVLYSGCDLLSVQPDGNIVISAGSVIRWSTNTKGVGVVSLMMQNDGIIVALVPSTTKPIVWMSPPTTAVTNGIFTFQLGYSMISEDQQYKATFGYDSNLRIVEVATSLVKWQSYTTGRNARNITLSNDGRLIMYNADGDVVWANLDVPSPSIRLVMENQGILATYEMSTQRLNWMAPIFQSVSSGFVFRSGYYLESPNQQYRFVCEFANTTLPPLVVWNMTSETIIWQVDTKVKGAVDDTIVLQTDGNLVLYDAKGTMKWASFSEKTGLATLSMQDDGFVVLSKKSNQQITWMTALTEVRNPFVFKPGYYILDSKGSHKAMYDGQYFMDYFNCGGGKQECWSSGRLLLSGSGSSLVFESNGNLALYDEKQEIVSETGTFCCGDVKLRYYPNGELEVRSLDEEQQFWTSYDPYRFYCTKNKQ